MLHQLIRDDLHNVTVNGCHMVWWTFSPPVVIRRHSNPIRSIWFRAWSCLWEESGAAVREADAFCRYWITNKAKEKQNPFKHNLTMITFSNIRQVWIFPAPRLISDLLLDYMPCLESWTINYALWNRTNYSTEQLPAWLYTPLQN